MGRREPLTAQPHELAVIVIGSLVVLASLPVDNFNTAARLLDSVAFLIAMAGYAVRRWRQRRA